MRCAPHRHSPSPRPSLSWPARPQAPRSPEAPSTGSPLERQVLGGGLQMTPWSFEALPWPPCQPGRHRCFLQVAP